MEIFELRYFLAVAEIEHINLAAEKANASPGSLSKAISRLEAELQTPLFFKSGRRIRLTPEGVLLKKKAIQILQLEEDTRLAFRGKDAGTINVYISSDEILQSHFGMTLERTIHSLYPDAQLQFRIRSDDQAIQQVRDGEAHLAFITSEPPTDLDSKVIAKVEFQTAASKAHPLFKKYGSRKAVPIDELIRHPFVAPDLAVLGKTGASSSLDGWRDDKFPRKTKYKVCGLKLLENLVSSGSALAFLPDYFVKSAGLETLQVSGCPYHCRQTIRLVAKDPENLSWLKRVWSTL